MPWDTKSANKCSVEMFFSPTKCTANTCRSEVYDFIAAKTVQWDSLRHFNFTKAILFQ